MSKVFIGNYFIFVPLGLKLKNLAIESAMQLAFINSFIFYVKNTIFVSNDVQKNKINFIDLVFSMIMIVLFECV